jgi:predicted nucleic acid-binding protein
MALIVLDASVVIAHLDSSDALHDAATSALLEHAEDDLRLPASAYAETLIDPTARGRLEEARERIAAMELLVVPLDETIAERAASVRVRHRGLRLPDALVLATAQELGADIVLTGDRRWRHVPTVRVIA